MQFSLHHALSAEGFISRPFDPQALPPVLFVLLTVLLSPSIFESPCSSNFYTYPLLCLFHLNIDRMQALTRSWTWLSYMAFCPELYNICLVQYLAKPVKYINSRITRSETLQDFRIHIYCFHLKFSTRCPNLHRPPSSRKLKAG